jgi:hypothetical protein
MDKDSDYNHSGHGTMSGASFWDFNTDGPIHREHTHHGSPNRGKAGSHEPKKPVGKLVNGRFAEVRKF